MHIIALDLVRFFAALSVVLYHYTARDGFEEFRLISQVTKFGYLGVPLFFMISGYVIALSAKNRSPYEFAVSRFIRLYPAYWCGIIFTISMCYVLTGNVFSIAKIAANMTMLNDYIGITNIDDVYWTLQAELKFYGCVLLLLLFGAFNQHKVWLTIWVLLTTLFLLTEQPFFMGWFISPHYSPFFIAGITFYLTHKEGFTKYNTFMLFYALVLSLIVTFKQTESFFYPTLYEKYIAQLITLGFYLLFYCMITGKIALKNRKLYLTLGGITYPLYLIHSLVGTTIIDYYRGEASDAVIVVFTVVYMLIISWLIHIGIEKKVATPIKQLLIKKVANS